MYIVNQDRNMVVNVKQSASIDLRSNEIKAYIDMRNCNTLGVYKTSERAEEVFKQMLKEIFPAYVKNDILGEMIMNRNAYYMPEE